jgi:short subunit dehydrogenase-like uncharacterized protein
MGAGRDREHDVVVYGASGFVGKLTAAYLAEAAPEGARIALGGRSAEKLERVRSELPGAASEWPIVIADSGDTGALAELARSTGAVATTVGPYHRYGIGLVEACAEAGTNYADLTGETLFMRSTIDRFHEQAQASGARIVHTCGFDSIPSDIGVHLLHEHAAATGAGDLRGTTLVVVGAKGGVSGGTVESMRGQIDAARADRAALRTMVDPYALSPDRSAEPDLGTERDPVGVVRNPALGGYLAPFVMGAVNTRVVRRSNALRGWAYGRELRYRELMLGGEGPAGAARAAAIAGGIGALVAGLSIPPTRKLLDRVLPDPGEGPGEEARDSGFFAIDTHAMTAAGRHLVCRIRVEGDPGYKATAVMLGESALALALDGDGLPDAAGVLTPATGIGDRLAERLRAAGHEYDVVERG